MTRTTRATKSKPAARAALAAAIAFAGLAAAVADEAPIDESAPVSAGAGAALGSAAAGQTDAAPITLGWAELDASSIGVSQAGVLVPRQLMAALSFLTERWPSESELEHALARESSEAAEKARAAVAAARAKRDLAALTIRDQWKRSSEILKLDEAVAAAEATLAESIAQTAKPGASAGGPPAAGTAPIQRWKGHEKGSLLPVASDPANLCEAEGVDILVFGSVRRAGSFYAIGVSVYVAATGQTAFDGLEYAAPDGLAEAVEALAHPVAEAVLGRSFARAEIAAAPATASVILDGVPLEAGSITLLEGGPMTVRVEARGYLAEERGVEVALGEDVSLAFDLAREEAAGFTLESEPSGAAVHIDGFPAGVTPLSVEGAGFARVFRLSLDGYEDASLAAKPGAEAPAAVILAPSDGLSFDEAFDGRKDRFYRSLGWFVSALPVAVVSGGLFQAYADAAERALEQYGDSIDPDLVDRLNAGFYSSQTVFWASAAAAAGLAVNAAIRLAAYLAGADR